MDGNELLRAGAQQWRETHDREAQEQARRQEKARNLDLLVQQRTREAHALLDRFRTAMAAAGNPGLERTSGMMSKRAWRSSNLGFSEVWLAPSGELKFGTKGNWRDADEWIVEFISCKHVGTYETTSPDDRLMTLGNRLGQLLASNNVTF